MLRNLMLTSALLVGATSAHAAVVDFTELGTGNIGDRTVTIEGVVVDAPGATISIGDDNSICALLGDACGGALKLSFDEEATNLMFNVNGLGDAGFILAIAENDAGERTPVRADADGMVDLSAIPGITSVYLANQSGGEVSYSDLKFGDDTPAPAPIPLPATLPLLLAGLGGFAWLRRRAK